MPSNDRETLLPEQVLEITRVFEAPRALVFRLWSNPEHIARWWGPETCWLDTVEMDFREGGAWHFWMRNGAGLDHHISGVYRRIAPPERLTFTYINAYDGHEMEVDLRFTDLGGTTEMRFRQAPFLNLAERDGHNEGWSSTFDLLTFYVRKLGGIDRLFGPPRRDGVAEDIAAARERQAAWWGDEQREPAGKERGDEHGR